MQDPIVQVDYFLMKNPHLRSFHEGGSMLTKDVFSVRMIRCIESYWFLSNTCFHNQCLWFEVMWGWCFLIWQIIAKRWDPDVGHQMVGIYIRERTSQAFIKSFCMRGFVRQVLQTNNYNIITIFAVFENMKYVMNANAFMDDSWYYPNNWNEACWLLLY